MTEQRRYAIEFSEDAERALATLPKKNVMLILRKIEALADIPRPRGCDSWVAMITESELAAIELSTA